MVELIGKQITFETNVVATVLRCGFFYDLNMQYSNGESENIKVFAIAVRLNDGTILTGEIVEDDMLIDFSNEGPQAAEKIGAVRPIFGMNPTPEMYYVSA